MKKLALLFTSYLLTAGVLTAGLVTLTVSSHAKAKAKPVRWFEVEVILFTREIPHNSIREEFIEKVEPITYKRTRDLLTKFHYPDIKNLFYHLGGCSVEDQMHYELEQKYNALPSVAELTMQFADDPLATSLLEQPINTKSQPIDIEWFYQSFTPVDVTEIPQAQPDTCGETIDFANWYKALPYVAQLRHHDRSFEYHYDMYPRVIIAGERRHNNYVHLMSPANFKLRDIYRTLRRQPDMRPILHTSWRQPGFSPSRSRATRLYAGYDFSERFDFQGNLKPPQAQLLTSTPLISEQQTTSDPSVSLIGPSKQSVVDSIENVLAKINQGATVDYQNHQLNDYQNTQASQQINQQVNQQKVHEIDGLFRIYIDNFNYLHIDAEFNVRKEVDIEANVQSPLANLMASTDPLSEPIDDSDNEQLNNTRLENYHFKQTRRVISKQLHYFDHPYMGMIVQIRRHGW